MIGLDRLRHPLRRERRFATAPDRAQAAPRSRIRRRRGRNRRPAAHAAVVNTVLEHAAAAGMRDVEILLHHRAGAADLVADHRAGLRQQQIVHGALNAVALGLVLRRDVAAQRMQRRAVAAGGGDGLCGRENLVHRRRLPGFEPAGISARRPDSTRRDRPSRASRGAPALPPTASRSGGLRAASARSARRSPRNSRRCCPRCAAARRRSWRSACAGGRGRAVRWRGRFRRRRGRRDRDD